MAGFNDLFSPKSTWALFQYRPSIDDVMAAARDFNRFQGGKAIDETKLLTLEAYEVAPSFRVPHYHGTEDHPDGIKSLGSM